MSYETEFVSKQSVLNLQKRLYFPQCSNIVEVAPTHIISPESVKALQASTNIVTRDPAEWIPSNNFMKRKLFHTVMCSRCRTEGRSDWNYCRQCGSDMKGEKL